MTHVESSNRITVRVDTHKQTHVAVALDNRGAHLDELHVPATAVGYRKLEQWATNLGSVETFGVEGTGSYGAGLARFLTSRGHRVVEVNRPDRSTRYRMGKSDPIDAEMAARGVQAGVAAATPKDGTGNVEMIRMLKTARDSAVKACTQSINQIKGLLVTAPAPFCESLVDLTTPALLERCAALRPGKLDSSTAAAKHTLRLLARGTLALRTEAKSLEAEINRLTAATAPNLLASFGIGPNSVPASSGKTHRHRLNRGGDRQANAALHRIVVVRLRWHEPTKTYMARRLTEGKTKAEIIRCLKRYVAREIYAILCPPTNPGATPSTTLKTT